MTEPAIPLHGQLDALAEVPLPDKLWQRVDSGRRRKLQRRKIGTVIAALAFATLVATPLLVPLLMDTDAAQSATLVAYQPENGPRDIQADLHALDQALQAAYDRGASDAEVAPMWLAREALLAGIPSTHAASPRDRI